MKSVTINDEEVAAMCGMPLEKTYFDYADTDTDDDQRFVVREGSLVRILIANSGCINDMNHYEAKVLAEAIKKASEDAETFFRAQRDWTNAQFAKLNCDLKGSLQSSTFTFNDFENRIVYSVKLKIFEGHRICFIRSIDREGTEKLLHSSTSTDKTISEKVAGLELKAYLLKLVKKDDDVVSREGI